VGRQIDFDPTYHYLYTTDAGSHRIQICNLVNTTVTPITAVSRNDIVTATNQLYHSNSLCVSRKIRAIYVADAVNHRIQRWNVRSTQGVSIARNPNGGCFR
jgi:sugar lactone lactonase YvrE